MPGIDPKDVKLEVAGSTPQFVDLEKLSATHRHGLLRLTLPIKDSVKPRRIEIQTHHDDQRQLTASSS